MLTTEEVRFIRNWDIQRKGGKGSYFGLYLSVGTIVGSIGVFFLMSMIKFGLPPLPILVTIPAISFTITLIYCIYSWNSNEKRWKKIIKRVVEEGKKVSDFTEEERFKEV